MESSQQSSCGTDTQGVKLQNINAVISKMKPVHTFSCMLLKNPGNCELDSIFDKSHYVNFFFPPARLLLGLPLWP